MNRLVSEVTSQYIEAANRLRPKNVRHRIVAYVESYQDVAFWRLLLDEFESDKVTFSIMLPSQGRLLRGKKSALSNCISSNSLGKSMIACVDSDYDYLMQGATRNSDEFLSNPYVIQTYTYAIENYQCYAGSLNQVCAQCTLNDNHFIDLDVFFELYSDIIYPLFLWNIWYYRKHRHNDFSMQDFNNCIVPDSLSLKNPQDTLKRLSQRVARKVETLGNINPDAVDEVEKLGEELLKLGVKPKNTYLFIQGHFLMERVVPKVMTPLMAALRHEREAEISRQAVHDEQRRNELSSYKNTQVDLFEAIRDNTHYRGCELYQRMRDDLRRMIEGFSQV